LNLSLLENANIQPKQKQTRRDGSFIVTSGPSLVGRLRAEAWVSASFQIFAISPNIVRSTIFDITRPIVTLTLSLPLATIYSIMYQCPSLPLATAVAVFYLVI